MADTENTNKIYRYEALLQAIDFFTQRFSLDQLGCYAFDFTNEILTLHSAALFVREEDGFVQGCSRLYTMDHERIPHSQALENLPVLHGDIITGKFQTFFDEDTIARFQMKLVIPLIIHDYLYGFIISNGKILDELNEEDRIIASALTKLYRSSLENSSQIQQLNQKTVQLDQKIFNLFAINQSAKSLLSEVNLEALYALATDVFSEITSSKVTSFGIYDPDADRIKVLGYRDVTTYLCRFTELELNVRTYESQQVVLEMERDQGIIKAIFKNWEEFEILQTQYVILLVKDQILGVVTLSRAVNDRQYDNATFELVETLASFTHIAISNALLVKELVEQKERAQRKFHTLNTLNQIMGTLNQSNSLEELFQLALKALSLNFGVKKAFFATQIGNSETYEICHQIGWEALRPGITFTAKGAWEEPLAGEVVTKFSEEAMGAYFERDVLGELGSANCVVIAPLVRQTTFLDTEKGSNSFLVVLETKDSLKEEEVLLIDTITKNLSPVVYQMEKNRELLLDYRPDPLKQFTEAIKTKLQERTAYNLDFYVYYQKGKNHPFQKFVLPEMDELEAEVFEVGGSIFLISYSPLAVSGFHQLPAFDQVEFLYDFEYLS